MENFIHLFSINTIFFTVFDYPMSYIEFFGTIFNIWCVWLTAKGKVSSWPVGMVGIVLYFFLFYQIRLYSDLTEQIYFFILSIFGWWMWLHPKTKKEAGNDNNLKVSHNTFRVSINYSIIIILGTMVMGYLMGNIHIYLPKYFPEQASYPYLDAFTTVMSFAATILLVKKKIESWFLWILVDIIGIGLYYAKGVKFISLEYVLFLILATKGLYNWIKEYSKYEDHVELSNADIADAETYE
jgi:nicotinamide mononucleotide transporter